MQGCPSTSQQKILQRTCNTDRSSVTWNENDEHISFDYLSAPRVRNVPSLYPHAYILKNVEDRHLILLPASIWFSEYSEKTVTKIKPGDKYDKEFVVHMII
jgi:hypothetical protein